MGEDTVAHAAEPDRAGACDHLRTLADRVRSEGVVHVEVDGTAMVCMTAAAHAQARSVPATTGSRPPTVTSPVPAAAPGPVPSTVPVPVPALGQTDRRILHLIHRGLTASEVADALELDLRVLTDRLTAIRGSYGVTSTREAVRRAADAGAFPVGD